MTADSPLFTAELMHTCTVTCLRPLINWNYLSIDTKTKHLPKYFKQRLTNHRVRMSRRTEAALPLDDDAVQAMSGCHPE